MTAQLGYLLPTRENVMRGEYGTGDILALAQTAAGLGFDSLWVGDSVLARPRHDPITMLAGVATAVPDVKIGTAVLVPMMRNPVLLAQQLATLDQLSDGRLIVGVGIGADNPGFRAEFEAMGVPFEKRVGTLMEQVDLMRTLWRGEPVEWNGRWTVNASAGLAPEPVQAGGPPLWLAAGVKPGIARAAKHFDGWFPIGPDAETFGKRHDYYNECLAEDGTRQSTTAIYLTICLDEDSEAADAAINAYMTDYYGAPPEILRKVMACFGGSIEEVMAFIKGYVDAGADHVVLRLVSDHHTTLKALADNRHLLG
jgi:alkanesulfonate monooxygenase SsuD/methylene tetrahydromethanopterin reductase-like flavin-dependent oxidoreductase (luciferase family)